VIQIIFELHAATFDDELGKASGWNDAKLSPKGVQQARELGHRYSDVPIKAVFSSDLSSGYTTAKIAFDTRITKVIESGIAWNFAPDGITLIKDRRLRECNFGDYTGEGVSGIHAMKKSHIETPFPRGESYVECMNRMRLFLNDVRNRCQDKVIMVIGHETTYYALEHFLKGRPLFELLQTNPVRQLGWRYDMEYFKWKFDNGG
jgi:broad specificity phosphatase PhoE